MSDVVEHTDPWGIEPWVSNDLYRAIMINLDVRVYERPSVSAARCHVQTEFRVGLSTRHHWSKRSGGAVVEMAMVARSTVVVGQYGPRRMDTHDIIGNGRAIVDLVSLVASTDQWPCSVEWAREQMSEWDWERAYGSA
jgi:hypothetical protein